MKIKLIICQALLAMLLFSCKEYKQSEHGFEYKFIVDKESDSIEVNKFCLFRADYYNDENYMFSSHRKGSTMPGVIRITQQALQDTTPLFSALKMLTVGDSAIFKFNANELFQNSFMMPLPDSVSKESNIFARMSVEEVLSDDEFDKYLTNIDSVEFEKQQLEIDKLLADEKLEVGKTASGLRYVILKEGTGVKADSGDVVSVHYTGTLLDGTKFDSSVDRDEPFEFTLGVGQVIPGWDEGIALLSKGAKAKLYIPSKLGYGMRGSGSRIPPNSILVFEVELVDIKES